MHNRTVKRILSFMLSACFLISVLVVPGSASSNTTSISELEQSVVAAQTMTTTAYMAMVNSFAKTRSGEPVYPSDYGGAYQKDGKLHVCITDTSLATVSSYSAATQNSDCVVYDYVDYSYETLKQTADYISEDLFDELDLTYVAIKCKTNAVEVGLDPDCAANTQNSVIAAVNAMLNSYLETEAADYSNILTLVCDVYGYEDGEARLTAEEASTLTQTESASRTVVTLYGGDYIYYTRDGVNYKSSFAIGGYIGTLPGILSCGHGKTSGMTIYSNSAHTNVIGTVVIHQYTTNEYYDYSLIQTNSNYSPNQIIRTYTGTSTPGLTTIYNSWTAIEGDTVFTYGHNSSYSGSYGVVDAIYVTVNAESDDGTTTTIKGLTRVERLSGVSQGGDSGCPVYAGAAIYGCHHGSATDANQTYTYFSPTLGGLTFTSG